MVLIDFTTGDYEVTDALSSIPGVSAFDNTLTNLRADFDTLGNSYVYGLTNMIGTKSIGYNVGYVMGLSNDLTYRQTNFYSDTPSVEDTYSDLMITSTTVYDAYLTEDYPYMDELDIDVDATIDSYAMTDIIDHSKFWTYEMEECQPPSSFINDTSYAFYELVISNMADKLSS